MSDRYHVVSWKVDRSRFYFVSPEWSFVRRVAEDLAKAGHEGTIQLDCSKSEAETLTA